MLPNLLLAAVVLVVGFFIAKVARSLSKKLISKVSNHNPLSIGNIVKVGEYMGKVTEII